MKRHLQKLPQKIRFDLLYLSFVYFARGLSEELRRIVFEKKGREASFFLLRLTVYTLVCYNMYIIRRKDFSVKKITLKKFLPEQKTVRFLIATLLLTLGVYLAYPVHGIVATLPFCFFASILAYLIFDRMGILLGTVGAIAFFYGLTTDFYDPFSFALFSVLSTLFAALAVRGVRSFLNGKKVLPILSVAAVTVGAILIPLVFSGTPTAFLSAQKEAKAYFSTTYPEQKFEEITVYYNLREGCYSAEVEYLYEENDLTSSVLFSEKIKDGFLDDFVSWMQEKRKSHLIDVVKKSEEDVLINSAGLSEKTPDGVFHGYYGKVGTEMEPLFHFSATFREEKPERRGFADACRSVMATIGENDFVYGSITFYALDAGNVVYECTVTPETDPETVLSLVKYAK